MAAASYSRPYRYLFRLWGLFGSGHQDNRSAAGFTGNTAQSTLLTYMAFKSRVQGFVTKLLGPAMPGE
jgi:hypothetical protein